VWSRDTTKKEFIENQQKRNGRPETKESVCQGLSLAPIHRNTQIDLKIEKGGVVKGHNKKTKMENQEQKE
jgi:hypothetical protein